MTSFVQHEHSRRTSTVEQQNQQEKRRTNDHINEQNKVDQQDIVHSIQMTNGVQAVTQSEHDDDDDGHYSDESNCSDDFR
jgi:DNA-directed RNA polymerase specialized sigma subunit